MNFLKPLVSVQDQNDQNLYIHPSELFQKTSDDNEDQIRSIVSFTIGDGSSYPGDSTKKIKIWAEELIVQGVFRAQDIQLSVSNLSISNSNSAQLTVKPDAQKGDQPPSTGSDGQNGEDGTPAGTIDLFLNSLSSGSLGIQIDAQGGDGESGQDSIDQRGGYGGIGGSGGDVNITYLDTCSIVQESFKKAISSLSIDKSTQILTDLKGLNIDQVSLSDGTSFGNACAKLAEIFTQLFPEPAIKNILDSFCRLLSSNKLPEAETKIIQTALQKLKTTLDAPTPPEPISSILQPMEGEPFQTVVLDIDQTIEQACTTLTDLFSIFFSNQKTEIQKTIVVKELLPLIGNINEALTHVINQTINNVATSVLNTAGNNGRNGDGPQGVVTRPSSNTSTDGLVAINPISQVTQELEKYIDPAQTMMLVQNAGLHYFLAALSQHLDQDDLKQTCILLDRLAIRLAFIPDLTGDNSTDSTDFSYQSLISSYQSVTNWQKQLSLGLDFYGNSYGYVPLLSFSTYFNALVPLITNFQGLEISYTDYFQAEEKNNITIDNIRDALSKQKMTIDHAADDLRSLQDLANQIAYSIFMYTDPILQKRQALDQAIQELSQDIESYFNFSWKDFLSACSTIALAPESPLMYMTQAASFLDNSLTTISQDDGLEVNKDYLVAKMTNTAASIDNILETYSANNDGTLQPEDPAANKIIVQQDEFITFLENFQKGFPDDIESIKTLFTDYVQTIIDRNNKILDYNAYVGLMRKSNNTINSANQIASTLTNKSFDALQPDLPLMTAYMSKVYIDARAQIMQVLYALSRAYEFWSLSDNNLLAISPSLSQLDWATLNALENSVNTAKLNALESLTSTAQIFPGASTDNGICIVFDDQNILNTFKQSNAIVLPISPVRKNTSDTESPFAHKCNIRVNNVRVWLDGVIIKDKDGPIDDKLQLKVTHTGRETIISQNDASFQFSHEQIIKEFVYYSETKKIDTEANFGHSVDNENDTLYSLVGPFTTWRIELENNYTAQKSLIDALKDNNLVGMRIQYPGKTTLTVKSITQEEGGDIKIEIQNIVNIVVKTLTVNLQSGTIKDETGGDLTQIKDQICVIFPSETQVDLSGLTSIVLEFSGQFYPFN